MKLPKIISSILGVKPKTSEKVNQVPIQLMRIKQDAQTRKEAIAEIERAYFPFRYKLQQLYLNTRENGHITACVERRKDLTLLRKFVFTDQSGNHDEKTASYFVDTVNNQYQNKQWFNNFISHSLDALFFGYTLVHLGDIIDGEFNKLECVKRWYVSPDRKQILTFPYMLDGKNFEEDEQLKDWYVYVDTPNDIGTSPCGYGLYFEISIYEIFLRNLLGFNGDFVEMFAQPYRVGKTVHTSGPERDAFEAALQFMGSNGWAVIDPQDQIEFLETSLGGTGYKSYDNLELRLEKKISKVILGHADAMDSIPGKLGNSGEKSPAEIALEDKQTKDGTFIAALINNVLIPKMRNLGFSIPEGVKVGFANDSEVMQTAHSITDLAVKMKQGGLQMDSAYYTEQTGIPVSVTQVPKFNNNIQNKLKKLYELQ